MENRCAKLREWPLGHHRRAESRARLRALTRAFGRPDADAGTGDRCGSTTALVGHKDQSIRSMLGDIVVAASFSALTPARRDTAPRHPGFSPALRHPRTDRCDILNLLTKMLSRSSLWRSYAVTGMLLFLSGTDIVARHSIASTCSTSVEQSRSARRSASTTLQTRRFPPRS